MTFGPLIVKYARDELSKPYQHKAYGPNYFDCLGLCRWIVSKIGYPVPLIEDYSRNPSGKKMRRELQDALEEVRITNVSPGDFFHMAWNNQPQHLAIVSRIMPLSIIHADMMVGAVVEHPVNVSWRSKIRNAYRLPERSKWPS